MAPWMVIAALIGVGFLVLLVAPTLHRSINARSRATVEAKRVGRAHDLRASPEGATRSFADARIAMSVRDRLLLRGVRAEVVSEPNSTVLIYRAADGETLDSVIAELGID